MSLILPEGFIDARPAAPAPVAAAPTGRTGLLSDGWWHRATPSQRWRIRQFVKIRLLEDINASDAEADLLIASLEDEARERLERHAADKLRGVPDGF